MSGQRVKLWDRPTRLIHWSLVLLIPALWWTWKSGQMTWHIRLGYVALGLILFRLLWGLIGASTARFSGFVKGPKAVSAYLGTLFAKRGEPIVGHNPLGGWSVVALLLVLVGVLTTGLFVEDEDGLNSGPLNHLIHGDLSSNMAHWHQLLFNGLLVLIAIHLCAILFYAVVKRDNLVGPMWTGRRDMSAPLIAPSFAPLWRLVLGVVLAVAVTWWISRGAPWPPRL